MGEAGVLAAPETDRDLDDLLATARAAAQAAADVATAWRRNARELRVEEKAASDDLVSQADRDAERAARAVLRSAAPEDEIIGEEGGIAAGRGAVRWLVDPIDGTTNYLYDRPDWAVSVAAVRVADGEILAGVVVEPATGRTTSARRGGGTSSDGRAARCARHGDLSRALVEINLGAPAQRRLAGATVDALVGHVRDVRRGGSAAVALAQVATGRADAYWGPGLQPWDAAAGLLLVAEAGGTIGDLDGPTVPRWPQAGDVLAAAPGLFAPLRKLLGPVRSSSTTG